MKTFTTIFVSLFLSMLTGYAQISEFAGNLIIRGGLGSPYLAISKGEDLKGYLQAIGLDMYLVASQDDLHIQTVSEVILRSNAVVLDPKSGDDAILRSNPDDVGGDLFLESNDAVIVRIDDNNNDSGNFYVVDGNGTNLFQVTGAGDVKVKGTTVHGSDRNRKEQITNISYPKILEAINEMPIYEWQYKGQDRRHIGPMAQDFFKAFKLGDDDKSIAAIDSDGVALAAVKAQQDIIEQQRAELDKQNHRISTQQSELDVLREKMQHLESLLMAYSVTPKSE